MIADDRVGPAGPGAGELESLRGASLWLLVLGIALIIVGVAIISSSFLTTAATITTMWVFGILLLLGAGVQVVAAVWGRRWRAFFLHLLAAVLYFIVGVFLIERPVEAAVGLTLVVAACLIIGGILRIVLSVVERFDGWGWVLLNGLISLLLGMAIWEQWPFSGFWVIGLFVGIEMLFSGLSWVMLALAVRAAPRRTLPTS